MTTRPTPPPHLHLVSSTFRRVRSFRYLAGLLAVLLLGRIDAAAQQVSAVTMNQIQSLLAEKNARTPAQQKMDSQLIYFAKQNNHQAITAAVPTLEVKVDANANGDVLVDFKAAVSEDLLNAIAKSGGTVQSAFPQYNAVRARVPIAAIEALAGRDDVHFVEPAAQAMTNVGTYLSEGDRTHRADTARAMFPTKGGSGIKVGVLSNGVDSLANSIATLELNADTAVIPGQASTGDEGTAMMEIVQDLVPNAKIYFATGNGGPANMANNILLLQAAGCTVIVDDETYFNESPFQDQVISQAVSTVSAAGVMYFSSARNSGSLDYGNSLTNGGGGGTSGTWEGDWVDSGVATPAGIKGGTLLNFGGGVTANIIAASSTGHPNAGSQGRVDFFWSDPLGASSNDYDIFVVDSTYTILRASSTNIQNGTQDPYESTAYALVPGDKILVMKTTAAAPRFLHLDVGRRYLTIGTAGNVRGHNAAGAANAFSVAATDVALSPVGASPNYFVGAPTNIVEYFSSDGPRRIFYQPNGTAITPGDVSSTGGQVLLKPDFTAANGVATSLPGSTGLHPFYGTSAAAPHAAAIAALIKSYNPALTPAQIRTMLTSTALDIEGAGYDRDSGSGIIMALAAIQASPAQPDALTITGSFLDASGSPGGPFSPTSRTYTLMNTLGSPLNWTAAKTQSWVTLSATSGTLAANGSTTVTVSVTTAINAFSLGTYSDTVTFTNTTSAVAQTRGVTVSVLPPPPANDNFANAILLSGISAQATGISNTYATKEAGEPNHAGDPGGHSVWWKWVAPGSSSVSLSLLGSSFDTLLGVYTGSSVSTLTTIASNDDAPGMGEGIYSSLTFNSVAGTTYYIAVDGWEGATGSVVLTLAYTPKSLRDFNGDGKSDILLTNTTTGDRAVWLMNGTAISTGAVINTLPTNWSFSGTGDFNGDGKSDIVLSNTTTGERAIWLMNGTAISAGASLGLLSTDWIISGTGDFNGDGKSDIVLTNTVTGERAIWLMNGTAISAGASLGLLPTSWVISGTGDFNGDGKSDVLLTNTTTGDRAIWLMNGTAISAGAVIGTLSTSWSFSGTGDFNGDGKSDIILTNTATGERAVWLMNGTAIGAGASLGLLATDWSFSATGDFDGDGKSDIVLTNTVTGERAIWLMNGTAIGAGASLGFLPTTWQITH